MNILSLYECTHYYFIFYFVNREYNKQEICTYKTAVCLLAFTSLKVV